jgi:hypothetical protein
VIHPRYRRGFTKRIGEGGAFEANYRRNQILNLGSLKLINASKKEKRYSFIVVGAGETSSVGTALQAGRHDFRVEHDE